MRCLTFVHEGNRHDCPESQATRIPPVPTNYQPGHQPLNVLKEFYPPEVIVSLIQFNGKVLLATNCRVYQIRNDKIEPLEFTVVESE